MKTPFALEAGESVVNSWTGAHLKSAISMQTGRVWLTNQRLIFQPTVMFVFWLMPLVGLIMWLMAKNDWRRIPLRTIDAHERTTFGRNKNVMKLATGSGEVKLLVDQFDAFSATLESQRKAA